MLGGVAGEGKTGEETSCLSIGKTVMCLSEIYKSEEIEFGEQIMHLILDVLNYN